MSSVDKMSNIPFPKISETQDLVNFFYSDYLSGISDDDGGDIDDDFDKMLDGLVSRTL